ncbi:hypothetical protein I203_106605 [Kwoniella mangroviensis CBS 8507]|uniref:uncharacterized protein n=1 Tax=Kwoniella mangroviensis CBS 8507 TaxID=1296122 RepID=UPI00080D3EC3|nr:uncharacterized protein I203_06898 [Kwoniella mangroviensis CBS 8507]OCF63942.1 hypothetical protein I203_06898 [Kwoniella mangroviensis CBS 8507]
MSSSSPVKPPSLPSRSSSQLSLDSHLSSPRKRYEKTAARPSLDHNGIRPPSAIYLGEESGSGSSANKRHSGDYTHDDHPHLRMASGFASVHVGIGSPKLDFARRDWPGSSHKRKEGSSSTEISPEVRQEDQIPAEHSKEGRDLVDRVSGLPSPPGTESGIAAPNNDKLNGESSEKVPSPVKSTSSSSKSPTKLSRRTSSTGSAHLIARRTSSYSGSSTHVPDSPRLRTHALRPKHSPSLSMSRSGSSSSSLVASPSMAANRITDGSTTRGSVGLSRTSSHSSSLSLGGNASAGGSSPRKKLPPLDTKRANSPEERISSPERTAKRLPPVSAGIESMDGRRHSRRSSRDLREEIVEEEPTEASGGMSRTRSQGSELDDKIREAEERIAQAALHRRRRSIDVEKNSTPSRQPIRRHDSFTRATGSPIVNPPGSALRRTTTLSSNHTDSPSESIAKRVDDSHETPEKGEDDRERSGGSSSSRRRKGLPAEFRNGSGSLFTPSPQKPKSSGIDDQPGSARSSRLRQFLDFPSDYQSSSPIPSRFSTTSRRSGEMEIITSPSKAFRHIDGLERSSSLGGPRGETSGYSKRNWSQSISGLPRASDEVDYRGLPRDRYRSETVLGGSTYQSSTRVGEDRGVGRRGISTLVSERDLLAASRSRVGALGPGDSVSAVGSRNDRGDGKDPLEMIRRLEEQRAESKKRWDHMPRPATSMSSMREIYNDPPNTAPLEPLRHRRSIDQDSPISPPYVRGGASRLAFSRAGGPSTEPRSMRSSTSLGGRSSANFDLANSSTEHGRLLFEAFRVLESKLGQEILSTHPEMLRTFHSATRTSENINAVLRNALQLASQIAVDAELDDPAKVREEYSNLAFMLRDAGKASEQNVRDMTRVLLDLPKLVRIQENGSGMTSSTSASVERIRRSGSAALNYNHNPVKQGVMSEDRPARRWQPTSPITQTDRSPLQGRYSMDTPRRSYDLLRSSTAMADTYSPLSRYSSMRNRDTRTNGNLDNSRTGGSTVSSLMSKVRAMTPRKSPSKLDLSIIEQSPPIKRTSSHTSTSPNKSPEREKPLRNLLKKKTSTLSTNTIKGSTHQPSNFLPASSSNKPTTAISQVTAGDLSADDEELEPNSPMSKFSYNSQRRKLSISRPPIAGTGTGNVKRHSRNGSSDTFGTTHTGTGTGTGSYFTDHDEEQREVDDENENEIDAVSMLEQRLVKVAKIKEERGLGITPSVGEDNKRPSISDRFRASLRKGSSRVE